jgi:alpha-beta hydrolase superfamily lysophospholipase
VSEASSTPSRWIDLLVRLGLASGVGRFAAQYLVSRWLTRPPREKVRRTPSHLGLDWEPLSLRTPDRYRLQGWLVTPPRPRATVLLFHGFQATREQLLSRLNFLVPAGYRCIAVDHRAHGESSGRISSFGLYERHDVKAALQLARLHWATQPVAVLGVSMGAAAVCFAAADVRASARAVILESLYHDVLTAFRNRLEAGLYPSYFQELTQGVIRLCEWRLGQPASRLTPADHVADLAPAPLLILTGADDHHATPDEAFRLYERRGGPAQLLLVPGAGHEDVCEAGGESYRLAILGFLDRSLFGACPAGASSLRECG